MIAVDCSFVVMNTSQVTKQINFSDELLNLIFNNSLMGQGTLTLGLQNKYPQTYNASLVPVCGTSLFMQIEADKRDHNGESDADLMEFLQMKSESIVPALSLPKSKSVLQVT